MARHLLVLLHGERAGRLTQTNAGRLEYRYERAWLQADRPPISLSLPPREETFGHREAEPFFGGLLPEENARVRVARFLGVTANSDFALLDEIGGECAGAVSLLPEHSGEEPTAGDEPPRVLDDDTLIGLLDDLRATIFNVLIGNADAHAKNFSLLHGDDARRGVTLAPLYDLLSTLCYDGLSPKYATKIGSKATFEDMRSRHWDTFAESAGLAPPQVRKTVLDFCTSIPEALSNEIASADA